MKRIIAVFLCMVAVCGLLSGCSGGSGNDPEVDFAIMAGTYATPYTRSIGNMTIAVATNGQITITIVDGVEGTFVGTGVANHVGGFYVTCSGANNKQVSVNGTLRGTGLGRTAQGTIAGTISVTYNANFLRAPDVTVYANHYEGSFKQGSVGDNWFGDVNANGQFTGSLVDSSTPTVTTIPMTGNVYSNGSFKFTGKAGSTTYEATGNFSLSQSQSVDCNGILKGTKAGMTVTGDFQGHNAIGEG